MRHILNYLLIIIAAVSCGRPKDNSFVIEGNISDAKDSVLVVLLKTMDPISGAAQAILIDTLIDGRFDFQFAIEDSVDKYGIWLIGDRTEIPSQYATVYAEPGRKAVITGSGASPMKWKIMSEVKKQKDWQEYLDYTAEISSEEGLVMIDNSISPDKYIALTDSLKNERYKKALEYLEAEKTSEIWIDRFHSSAKHAGMNNNEDMKDKLKALLPRLSEEQMKSALIQDALRYLEATTPLNVGDTFPEMNLNDADGLPHKVSDYLGKKILIEFSTIGCAPCELAGPEIEQLCRTNPEDFVALIVNQAGYELWREINEASAVSNMLELNDDNGSSGIFTRLGTRTYPTFVLLSPEGIIIDIWSCYSEGSLQDRI